MVSARPIGERRRLASAGVEVQITELDLSLYRHEDRSPTSKPTPALLDQQAERYGRMFRMFREEAAMGHLTGVTFWGTADDQTWLDNLHAIGRKDMPLLFDPEHKPKKAFYAVTQF